MTRTILLLLALLAAAMPAGARTAHARIARIATAVATLQGVDARLDWPADAEAGDLVIRAQQVDAPDLGYHYRNVAWSCRLQRVPDNGWACAGDLRGSGKPLRFGVRFDDKATVAELAQGGSRIALHRDAKTPDLTRLDFARVPLAWAQALLAQAWSDGKLKSGTLDGRLDIAAPKDRPLRITGDLAVADAALETPDGGIAADKLAGDLRIDYRKTNALGLLELDGRLHGGEFLAGNTYIALPATPVSLSLDGMQRAGRGWELPRIAWRDGNVLAADGSAAFANDATLHALDLQLHSSDMGPLRDRYLSGWLGVFGLGNVELSGASDLRIAMRDGMLQVVDANLHGVDLREPDDRFGFRGLDGDVRFSASTPVASELRWQSSRLYGLDFGAATLPFASENGELVFREPVVVPAMGGTMTFAHMTLRPPSGDAGMDIRFAMALDNIDFGRVSKALGLPAFQGTLGGEIPSAHYANERLDFDGGLAMKLFDGEVRFSDLSMERPFGVAPSLSANIDFQDLDLLRLTEILDFGSITGRLDGHVHDLRLVDWTPVAFDAEMHSVRRAGTKQRISQRAVQNISSVGDASFVSSLQGKLIGLFDDFGYANLGISCRLANEVCDMGGLGNSPRSQAANSFTIVEGSGLPRLDVVGFNRSVDWPTLVERLEAVGKGDVKPVVE
ncbi:hypothetical protein FNZ56_01460 [Pseudoluteimonas lycopersici]|uniref:Dicarboxylate transport domain-containing protein n=1 Tax=Pseudoluteimonas lycopersici TaxID=1324796 RepID=A0A516V290_9GAMM|nr:hypothetical protein [Lysobacter lycopersici]QDQ72636.1 hypothetical protein FNZ56_01460 [Lysobacter lycopersici]